MVNPVEPAAEHAADESAVEVDVDGYRESRAEFRRDWVAAEEPLEIQLGRVPLAVVMRTPGHDEDLVRGLLLGERVIADPDDIASVRHCTRVSEAAAEDNVVRVRLRAGLEVDFERLRRNLFASASCGVCGKASIENALAVAPPLEDPARFEPELFHRLEPRLREAQATFARTGGLHAAALFRGDGELLVAREDVGRHNAVDKLIGERFLEDELPLSESVLMLSGRASFELLQKALVARIPVVAAVGAPSSLAVELAESFNITLCGFVKADSLNVYTGPERVAAVSSK